MARMLASPRQDPLRESQRSRSCLHIPFPAKLVIPANVGIQEAAARNLGRAAGVHAAPVIPTLAASVPAKPVIPAKAGIQEAAARNPGPARWRSPRLSTPAVRTNFRLRNRQDLPRPERFQRGQHLLHRRLDEGGRRRGLPPHPPPQHPPEQPERRTPPPLPGFRAQFPQHRLAEAPPAVGQVGGGGNAVHGQAPSVTVANDKLVHQTLGCKD